MKPRALAAATVVAFFLVAAGWWWLRPSPNLTRSPVERPSPARPVAAPEPAPTPAPAAPAPTEPAPSSRTSRTFERPPPSAETPPPTPAPRRRDPVRSMDDLPEAEAEAFVQSGLDNLRAVTDSCTHLLEEPLPVMARAVMDERGLLTMELSTYELVEDERVAPSEREIPQDFADCLDDALWNRPWYALEAGDEIPFQLTFDLQPEVDE